MKKLVLAAALAALPAVALVAAPERAEAEIVDGYVCTVQIKSGASASDNPYGYTVFSLYTQPDCAGSYIKTMNLCSSSSYGGACYTSVPYQQISGILVRAAAEDLRVTAQDMGWLSSTQLLYLTLNAD